MNVKLFIFVALAAAAGSVAGGFADANLTPKIPSSGSWSASTREGVRFGYTAASTVLVFSLLRSL